MWTYILRRLLQSVVVIFGVTLISFTALQIGGDPTYLYVSERATEEEIEMVREALGFDRPLYVQYLTYIGNVFQGDFGQSLSYRQPAIDIVLGALPATIELTLFAIFLAIAFAIPARHRAALNRGTPVDGGIMTMAMFGQSIPGFWLGIMMILFFGLYLRWFPISGHVPFLAPLFAGDVATAFRNLPQSLYYLVMPAVAVAFYSLSATRASCAPRCSRCWARTTSAPRGPRASPNAPSSSTTRSATPGCPVVTMIGLEFGFLLGGVVVIETVFSYPGIGRLVFNAINQRDIPVVQASVILLSGIFITLNLLVDLIYARLDPRVKLAGGK
jgi:peptide/nickel transport system permease protein